MIDKIASMDVKTASMIDKSKALILVFQEGNDYTRGEGEKPRSYRDLGGM